MTDTPGSTPVPWLLAPRRPGSVTAAAVLTWVGCGLVGLGLVPMTLLVAAAPAVEGSGAPRLAAGARQALLLAGVGGTLWCVVAAILAGFVLKRSNGARLALTVSGVAAALLCLIRLGTFISVVPLAITVVAVCLLYAGGANEWFEPRRDRPQRLYPPYGA